MNIDKLIEKTRTIYWYEGLAERNSFKTAYQLERFYEPESFRIEDKRTVYKNKWVNYRDGKHKPNKRLIQRVENKSPMSDRDIYHPLWEILFIDISKSVDFVYWIRLLNPETQSFLFDRKSNKTRVQLTRKKYCSQIRKSLLRNVSLDSIAALILFWYESKSLGETTSCESLAHDIYKALLISGMHFRNRNVSEYIYMALTNIIFSRSWQNKKYIDDFDYYARSCEVLYSLLWKVEGWKISDPIENTNLQMFKLVDGSYGFDIAFALKPIFEEYGLDDHGNEREKLASRLFYKEWLWGWLHLCNQTIGRIDDELWVMVQETEHLPDINEFISQKILRGYRSEKASTPT